MKALHRLALRSCFVAAAFTLLGLPPALSQNWIMDAQADLTTTTTFDCSSIAEFIPAPAIASASGKAGGFEIPANSKDSALVLYLDPGIYTVVVHNGSNNPGTVLVEAYVLE